MAADKVDIAIGQRVWGEPRAARFLPEHHFQPHSSRGCLDAVRCKGPDPVG